METLHEFEDGGAIGNTDTSQKTPDGRSEGDVSRSDGANKNLDADHLPDATATAMQGAGSGEALRLLQNGSGPRFS